jgi:hypothetical protein
MSQHHDQLLIAAQQMYLAVLTYVKEMSEQLQYLYVDPTHNFDVNSITSQLQAVRQEYEAQMVDPQMLYHRLYNIHEHARALRDQYVREGEHQRYVNSRTVEDNFSWMYQNIQLVEEKVLATDHERQFDRIFNAVESFCPTDYSMRNVERSNRLRTRVHDFLVTVYAPIRRGVDLQIEECGICRTLLALQPFYKLIPCEHLFHQSCVLNWEQFRSQLQPIENKLTISDVSNDSTCPLCASVIEQRLRYNSLNV